MSNYPKNRKTRKLSEETKKKIGLANSIALKGRINGPHSLETRKKISLKRGGKNSNFWKGGITPLSKLIRESKEMQEWRKSVFLRDDYTCVKCLKRGFNLQADHIYPFCLIFKDFLIRYSIFSPIEDKESLLRLSLIHEPFWELSNGRTLCLDCHKNTDTYSYRANYYDK